MDFGVSPFASNPLIGHHDRLIYKKTAFGIVRYPSYFSSKLKDLLKKLDPIRPQQKVRKLAEWSEGHQRSPVVCINSVGGPFPKRHRSTHHASDRARNRYPTHLLGYEERFQRRQFSQDLFAKDFEDF